MIRLLLCCLMSLAALSCGLARAQACTPGPWQAQAEDVLEFLDTPRCPQWVEAGSTPPAEPPPLQAVMLAEQVQQPPVTNDDRTEQMAAPEPFALRPQHPPTRVATALPPMPASSRRPLERPPRQQAC